MITVLSAAERCHRCLIHRANSSQTAASDLYSTRTHSIYDGNKAAVSAHTQFLVSPGTYYGIIFFVLASRMYWLYYDDGFHTNITRKSGMCRPTLLPRSFVTSFATLLENTNKSLPRQQTLKAIQCSFRTEQFPNI